MLEQKGCFNYNNDDGIDKTEVVDNVLLSPGRWNSFGSSD
jgi:hypothetical protein